MEFLVWRKPCFAIIKISANSFLKLTLNIWEDLDHKAIGVGTGKSLWVRKNFARKRTYKSELQRKAIHVNAGAFFSNQNMLGVIFAQIFRDFVKVLRDFIRIFWDFARIFTKSKLWVCGCTPAPPPPAPVHNAIVSSSCTIVRDIQLTIFLFLCSLFFAEKCFISYCTWNLFWKSRKSSNFPQNTRAWKIYLDQAEFVA